MSGAGVKLAVNVFVVAVEVADADDSVERDSNTTVST